MADYSGLVAFVMLPPGNTCNVSGVWMNAGDIVYANNIDEVRTGGAICAAVARPGSQPAPGSGMDSGGTGSGDSAPADPPVTP